MPATVLSSRRRLLAAGLGAVTGAAGAGAVGATQAMATDPPTGWLRPPRPVPALPIQMDDGRQRPLPAMLQGRVTALQLMFTGCQASCPTQGAAFGALAQRLRGAGWQLLSLSIDALGDTPQRLADWRKPFGAHPAWRMGLPMPVDVEHLREFFIGAPGRPGTHTAQVFVVDAQARLVWRSGDNPALAELGSMLGLVQQQG